MVKEQDENRDLIGMLLNYSAGYYLKQACLTKKNTPQKTEQYVAFLTCK